MLNVICQIRKIGEFRLFDGIMAKHEFYDRPATLVYSLNQLFIPFKSNQKSTEKYQFKIYVQNLKYNIFIRTHFNTD